MLWTAGRHVIDLSVPRVMGIVNVTPDSFSDGGRFVTVSSALSHAERLLGEGADILDIGGESTRPGARTPGVEEELERVLPVLRELVRLGVPLSVDTSEPEVMRAALDLGVDIVNDVRSLIRPGALELLAAHASAGVCLMHMEGEPGSMQDAPRYEDVVTAVRDGLQVRLQRVTGAGVDAGRIMLDPGIGFGKTPAHNLQLLARQRELTTLARPLLIGWSRKSTLGRVTERDVHERQAASVAAALLAVERGAAVVRVHDVAPTVDALKVWQAAAAA